MPRRPLDTEIARARLEADQASAVADAAKAKLDALIKAQSKLFDATVSEHVLHPAANRSNINSNMQLETAGKSRAAKISAGRSTIESDSRKAAEKADLTDGQIAEITGASRQAVQKWHTGLMAIPKRHAAKLVSRGIPLAAWQRIAD